MNFIRKILSNFLYTFLIVYKCKGLETYQKALETQKDNYIKLGIKLPIRKFAFYDIIFDDFDIKYEKIQNPNKYRGKFSSCLKLMYIFSQNKETVKCEFGWLSLQDAELGDTIPYSIFGYTFSLNNLFRKEPVFVINSFKQTKDGDLIMSYKDLTTHT